MSLRAFLLLLVTSVYCPALGFVLSPPPVRLDGKVSRHRLFHDLVLAKALGN
jgi:hypothetical protein